MVKLMTNTNGTRNLKRSSAGGRGNLKRWKNGSFLGGGGAGPFEGGGGAGPFDGGGTVVIGVDAFNLASTLKKNYRK